MRCVNVDRGVSDRLVQSRDRTRELEEMASCRCPSERTSHTPRIRYIPFRYIPFSSAPIPNSNIILIWARCESRIAYLEIIITEIAEYTADFH